MNVYLVRHTHVLTDPGVCYGNSDVELAETCISEMNEVINQLNDIEDPIVFSSPLKRCTQLARLLTSDIHMDERLKEMNFGNWELKKWDSITGPEADQWMNDFVNTRCPGGESFLDLISRVRLFLEDLKKITVKNVIIITHGGVIRAILSLTDPVPPEETFQIQVGYGQVIKRYIDQ